MKFKLFIALIVASTFGLHHSGNAQSLVKNPNLRIPSIEITASVSHVPIYDGDATVGKISSRGYQIEIGYRPSIALRRLLIKGYLFHVPRNRSRHDPVPRMNALGIGADYLLLDTTFRINPFVGIGLGAYRIDSFNEPACRIEEGCFEEGGPSFEDETMGTFSLNSGLYLNIIPAIALRGGLRLYTPFGSNYDGTANAESRLIYSGALSLRF